MSFGGGAPPPMIVPPAPQPAPQMTPVTGKPPRKAMQPTFVSQALAPTAEQAPATSLIGTAGR